MTQPQQNQQQQARPRSYSEAASAVAAAVTARQTVQNAMEQQASVRAHLNPLEDPSWRAAIESARGAFRLPPSLASMNSGERERSSSTGDLTQTQRRSGQ